jgi:hypothetical protein
VAKKGELKPVVKMNIGLAAPLAKAVEAAANRYERTWNEEVRFVLFVLKEFYGLNQAPVGGESGVSA